MNIVVGLQNKVLEIEKYMERSKLSFDLILTYS